MKVSDALERRRSIKWFDPEHRIDDDTLRALLTPTLRAPTSFNLQHWRFVAVRDKAVQEELCVASFGQRQVADCSATILITCKLPAHEDASRVWDGAPPQVQASMVKMIEGFYGGNDRLQRDEAIRSGGLVAMTLMLMAAELDLETCPMIGFDPKKVRAICHIPDDHVITLMMCVGVALRGARPRVGRFDLSEVVRLDAFDGPSLDAPE